LLASGKVCCFHVLSLEKKPKHVNFFSILFPTQNALIN
jgi:hypothetical protein